MPDGPQNSLGTATSHGAGSAPLPRPEVGCTPPVLELMHLLPSIPVSTRSLNKIAFLGLYTTLLFSLQALYYSHFRSSLSSSQIVYRV
jgi:hypothetical protein